MPVSQTLPPEPARDCPLCPRLAAFREQNAAKFPDFYNGPVPSFGSTEARLLIVGLAPGLKGANRTARPFTGDYAGICSTPPSKSSASRAETTRLRPMTASS